MEQKLHTPEGVRDIYNRECAIKLALQKKLNTVLHLYGYQDIQTPTFEYFVCIPQGDRFDIDQRSL